MRILRLITMKTKVVRHIGFLYKQQDANSATEYAVMLSLIVLASFGAIVALGSKVAAVFQGFSESCCGPF
jgi:Flp pilus assembly pilin Flp